METKKTKSANLENKRFLFFQIGLIVALGASLAAFEYSETFKVEEDVWEEPKFECNSMVYEIPNTYRKKADVKPFTRKLRQLINFEIVKEFTELPDDLPELTTEPVDPSLKDFANAPTDEEEGTDEPQPFILLQDKPEFPGGMKALYRFINKNIKYPWICQDLGIHGTVHVRFIIDKKGYVTNVELVKGVDRNLDKEAMRVIAMMPKWKPGKQRDVPVNVSFQMPVRFNFR